MTKMKRCTIPDDVEVDATLTEWRRRAVEALLVATVIAYLPAIVFIAIGEGLPFGEPVWILVLAGYLVVVAAAILRRIDYRSRMLVTLGTAYVLAFIANVAVHEGPFARTLPVGLPVLAFVLVSQRSGRVATLISATILLAAPLFQHIPSVARSLGATGHWTPAPAGVMMVQGLGMVGLLVTLMLVVERSHGFLMQALTAQIRAAADLEREAADRASAHAALECEMKERRRLERAVSRIGDEERRRLGQNVHDGVCQQLTGALLRCQALERRLERGGSLTYEEVGALSSLLEETIDEAYAISRGLCPLEPDPDALAPALRALTRRIRTMAGVRCEFQAMGDVRVSDPETAQHLYRIAQEALSNAARHALAARIRVELCGCDDELLLRVEDDGRGMPPEIPTGGMGLRTMAYRAHIMEGALTVEPAPEGGTRVVCRVPRCGRVPLEVREVETGEGSSDGH